MAIGELDLGNSIKYNAWNDLPPASCQIMKQLACVATYRLAADKYSTYLLANPSATLVSSEQLLSLAKSLVFELKFEQAVVVYQVHTMQFPEDPIGWIEQAKLERERGDSLRSLLLFQEAYSLACDSLRNKIEAEMTYLRFELFS